MCSPIVAILVLAVLLGTPTLGLARQQPYVLRQQVIARATNQEHVILRLYRRHAGRPLWTRAVGNFDNLTWSRGRRAFVAWGQRYPDVLNRRKQAPFVIFSWRAGHRLTQFHSPRFDQLIDYFWDFHWSPDARLVAFRAGGSGMQDLNVGRVFLYDTARNKLLSAPKGDIGRVQWISSRTLRFWPRVFRDRRTADGLDGSYYNAKPRLWHLPI
ncbi:MAG TPA: hypothetical protein VFW40_00035 [Capsulimonadaceae bacterium]|nr:hypothetical protein [Capsulimonadaceae bacterium]